MDQLKQEPTAEVMGYDQEDMRYDQEDMGYDHNGFKLSDPVSEHLELVGSNNAAFAQRTEDPSI